MFTITTVLFILSSINQAPGSTIQRPDDRPPIELTVPKDVTAARAVQETVEELGAKVTECVTSGQSREVCRCNYPELLTRLRTGYDSLLKEHPDWSDRSLSFRHKGKDGQPVSGLLALRTLRRQLETLACK